MAEGDDDFDMNTEKTIEFSTTSINENSKKKDYVLSAIKLIESVLKNSKFGITVTTNEIKSFEKYSSNERVSIIDVNNHDYPTSLGPRKLFNMHNKRFAIENAIKDNVDYVIYLDCDGYLTENWNDKYSLNLFEEMDGDVFVNRIYSVGGKNKNAEEKGKTFWWKEVMGDLWDEKFNYCYAPQETHMVFKNNEKLKLFNDFWKEIEKKSFELNNYPTTHIGYPIACSICKSNMKINYYKGEKWEKYFKGFLLNHMGEETYIISGQIKKK